MRRAAHLDKNHKSVKDYVKACGCLWHDTAGLGGGFPDAIAGYAPTKRLALVEIKNGAKARTKPETRKRQEKFHAEWPVFVVRDDTQARMLVEWLKEAR